MRARAPTESPRAHRAADPQHPAAPRDENDVDRLPRPQCVHGCARLEPDARMGTASETVAAQTRTETATNLHRQRAGSGADAEPAHDHPDTRTYSTKPITMKVHGKMHSTSGPSIRTGACMARFSA